MPWRLFAVAVLMNFPDLAKLLEERVAVIADHEFRDRDPEAHLEALKRVSEAIVSWHEAHRSEIDGNDVLKVTGEMLELPSKIARRRL